MTDRASTVTVATGAEPVRTPSVMQRLLRSRPSRPGESYGVPGNGESIGLSIATIVLLFATWTLVTWMGWVSPLFVPAPWDIANRFTTTLRDGFTGSSLLTHIGISTLRVFGAFAIACLVGIPLGLAMGISSRVRGIFDPPIEFYRPIPPLAYLPLMIIWFGIGELWKVLLIFLSVFAPVALGARSGVRSAQIEQIHAAYSFGATRWQVIIVFLHTGGSAGLFGYVDRLGLLA